MSKLNKPITVLKQSLIEELAAGSFGQRPPASHPIWAWAAKRADALIVEAQASTFASPGVPKRSGNVINTRRSDRAFYAMLDERFGNS